MHFVYIAFNLDQKHYLFNIILWFWAFILCKLIRLLNRLYKVLLLSVSWALSHILWIYSYEYIPISLSVNSAAFMRQTTLFQPQNKQNLIFHPLEVVSRYSDPHIKVGENYFYTRRTQNIWRTFVQHRPNVSDVGPTLYKCSTNALFLLGIGLYKNWIQCSLFSPINISVWRTNKKINNSWRVKGLISCRVLKYDTIHDINLFSAGTIFRR